MKKGLKIPFTCKIRILSDIEETIKLAKLMVECGCSILTVHGRTKEEIGRHQGKSNWEAIRKIKESVNIPVIANGSI